MDKPIFTPVRGIEDKIAGNVLGFNDGFVYFATDTGKIYMDYIDSDGIEHARASFGGGSSSVGNSGIFYANRPISNEEKLETEIYFNMETDIEGKVYPEKDDLILNAADGCFYRVLSSNKVTA
jgi:hypothetical protein